VRNRQDAETYVKDLLASDDPVPESDLYASEKIARQVEAAVRELKGNRVIPPKAVLSSSGGTKTTF
jgi:hypothetical protein